MQKWDDFRKISRIFVAQKFSCLQNFRKISQNFPKTFAKTINPLNLAVIRHAWYMWCNIFAITSHFRKLKTHMWVYVRIQLPKRKFHFRKIFAKISSRKLTLTPESLLMWNTWGMGLGLKGKFSFSYFRENLFSLFAKKAYESGWCFKTNRTTVLSTMEFKVVKSGWCFKTNRTTVMGMQ
jgi:hypothetical protein